MLSRLWQVTGVATALLAGPSGIQPDCWEKIARYSKLNQEVVPGKIAMANKAVQELAERHHAKYIDINDPLKDRDGNLKAEYTIEGMHIKEEGYRAIFDLFMGYAKEPRWNV